MINVIRSEYSGLNDMIEKPFHPGAYIQELLIWQKISTAELSNIIGVPESVIVDVMTQRRGVSKEFSKNLANYFGNTSQFWLSLQESFDMAKANNKQPKPNEIRHH